MWFILFFYGVLWASWLSMVTVILVVVMSAMESYRFVKRRRAERLARPVWLMRFGDVD